ncbi:unnamed protein product, partial [Phaeothamnion confervicola]
MAAFKDKINVQMDKLRRDLDKNAPAFLDQIEKSTKAPKEYLVAGTLIVVALCLISGFGAYTICQLTGFLYPAYQSLKAIESAGKEDDTQWLTYWLTFATLNIIEALLSFITDAIPFYFVLKVFFLIWLFLPTTRGAEKMYKNVLKVRF